MLAVWSRCRWSPASYRCAGWPPSRSTAGCCSSTPRRRETRRWPTRPPALAAADLYEYYLDQRRLGHRRHGPHQPPRPPPTPTPTASSSPGSALTINIPPLSGPYLGKARATPGGRSHLPDAPGLRCCDPRVGHAADPGQECGTGHQEFERDRNPRAQPDRIGGDERLRRARASTSAAATSSSTSTSSSARRRSSGRRGSSRPRSSSSVARRATRPAAAPGLGGRLHSLGDRSTRLTRWSSGTVAPSNGSTTVPGDHSTFSAAGRPRSTPGSTTAASRSAAAYRRPRSTPASITSTAAA